MSLVQGGGLAYEAVGGITSLVSLGIALAAMLVVDAAFIRWRFKRVNFRARMGHATTGAIPGVVAAFSLVIYSVALGIVHVNYFSDRTSAYARQSSSYDKRINAATAQDVAAYRALDRLNGKWNAALMGQLVTLRRLQSTQQRIPSGRSQSSPLTLASTVEAQLRTISASSERVSQLYQAQVAASRHFEIAEERATAMMRATPSAPSVTGLPAWFNGLQATFTTAAQILVALVLALVFSRRATRDRDVNAAFRVALFFALLGLVAATIGIVPSLPGSVQAILLGYTVAGLLSSCVAVFIIAGGWLYTSASA